MALEKVMNLNISNIGHLGVAHGPFSPDTPHSSGPVECRRATWERVLAVRDRHGWQSCRRTC